MSKFKIEKGVSRINRVKLQASIEEPLATELALMCEWSNNDRNYVVNELLRFALSQDAEFQAYKESVNSVGRRKTPRVSWSRAGTNCRDGEDRGGRHRVRCWSSSVGDDMGNGLIRSLKLASRTMVRHQILLSAGLSAAAGVILRELVVIPAGNPVFQYLAVERPDLYRALVWSFNIFLFTTPYLMLSVCFSLVYIHFYEEEIERAAGFLPPYPEPERRDDLFLILGERHQQLDPIPAVHPQWLSIPERGLYTGTIALGAIGSGKTRGLILPAMHQLFGYRPSDAEEKLSGIVLEVKGDLCRHLSSILKECGREADYIDVSLESDIRYNPLNNDLDPYVHSVFLIFTAACIVIAIVTIEKSTRRLRNIWTPCGKRGIAVLL